MYKNSRMRNTDMASDGTFELFSNSNYRLLWGTNFTMYVSRWMQMTTLSWFVLNLTDSAFKVAVVGFCGMAPLLFLGIFGGLLADKLNRKKLMNNKGASNNESFNQLPILHDFSIPACHLLLHCTRPLALKILIISPYQAGFIFVVVGNIILKVL